MLLSGICKQGTHTAVKYSHGYHHYLWWSLKRTDSVFSLLLFSTTAPPPPPPRQVCKLWPGFIKALYKISPQSAFSLWSLKLNLPPKPPQCHMSSPFPSPTRLWEMSISLLKMPQQRPFCQGPPWQHCLPLAGLYSLSFLPSTTTVSDGLSLRASWSLLSLSPIYIYRL